MPRGRRKEIPKLTIISFSSWIFSSPLAIFFLFFHCTSAANSTTNNSSTFPTPSVNNPSQLVTFFFLCWLQKRQPFACRTLVLRAKINNFTWSQGRASDHIKTGYTHSSLAQPMMVGLSPSYTHTHTHTQKLVGLLVSPR